MTEGFHRILAIDDVPSNLLIIRSILPPTEFSFQGVNGADEAFRLLESQRFDLILLDVLLPGTDGYEIARRLKADPATASLPVIFLSSLKTEEEIIKGFEAGAVDFVSKPFRTAELLRRVRTHLALKDKNEALERAADELRQANQARDQFFSILAHDLKNPFAGFLSLLDSILSAPESMTPQDLQESLQTMGQTAQNVYRLLETLLDWGRSQTGAMPIDVQVQPVQFLIEEALDPLEAAFHEKRITLGLEQTTARVLADRYTVVAILRNLLSNAMKFTKPGGSVMVRVVPEGEGLSVSVIDNGVGIPAHRIPLLFRIENKVSTKGTSREPGTGLGLILCAEFAQKNHGTLHVSSTEGSGSTFTLTLPHPLPEGL